MRLIRVLSFLLCWQSCVAQGTQSKELFRAGKSDPVASWPLCHPRHGVGALFNNMWNYHVQMMHEFC